MCGKLLNCVSLRSRNTALIVRWRAVRERRAECEFFEEESDEKRAAQRKVSLCVALSGLRAFR